jgi:hypothetical protein
MAGIRAEDEILSFGGKKVSSLADALAILNTLSPEEKLLLEVRRDQQTLQIEAVLDRLPTAIPTQLPPPRPADASTQRPPQKAGTRELKIPEFQNLCTVYLPERFDAKLAYGVVVQLTAPGQTDGQKAIDKWKPLCDQYELIYLAASPADPAQWSPMEVEYIRKVLHQVMEDYPVDRSRIVLHGERGGGTMAYLVGMMSRELVRAVAVVDASLPGRVSVPANDPVHRLAVYTASARQTSARRKIEESVAALRDAKYPVTTVDLGEQSRYLDDAELAALARWIDSLDRL